MAYVNKHNRTILTGIPVAPPFFFNITKPRGIYIIGQTSYRASRRVLSPILHRQVRLPFFKQGIQDFVLGVLTVVFISMISEVLQTVLMSMRQGTVSRDGLMMAGLVDEFSHLRNLWTHATIRETKDQSIFHRLFRHHSALLSLVMVAIAIIIFVVDVLAVYLAGPMAFASSEADFNLRAIQPIGTTRQVSRIIREESEARPCVVPIVRNGSHRRRFLIGSCITYDSHEALSKNGNLSDNITISSWYHEGGNDHNISFGDGWFSVSVRAELFIENNEPNFRTTKKLLFTTSGDFMESTRYLHNVTIYAIMEWSCNKKFSVASCEQLVEELELLESVPQRRIFNLWTTPNGIRTTETTGIVSTYRTRLNNPYGAANKGIHVLVASSAILEVHGFGGYEDESLGRQFAIPNLITEQGRIIGVYMFLLIILCTSVLLATLRLLLKPVSLGSLALYYIAMRGRVGNMNRGTRSTNKDEVTLRQRFSSPKFDHIRGSSRSRDGRRCEGRIPAGIMCRGETVEPSSSSCAASRFSARYEDVEGYL